MPVVTLLGAVGALWIGPVLVSPLDLLDDPVARTILFDLRAPRVLGAVLIGGALGTAGVLLQALLRNPLADPALLGVSGGGALGAALALAAAATAGAALSPWSLPVPLAAFVGALGAVLLVSRLGAVGGRLQLAAVLLAGIAVNTLAGALVGLLLAFGDDATLRSTSFWLFGSLTRLAWPTLLPLVLLLPPALWYLERRAADLDLYQLGDREAGHAGLAVRRLQWQGLVIGALLTGLAVAVAGIIGFVGLMVPHLVRLVSGPSHRGRIRDSALAGALLLLIADAAARTVAAPAEIPLGLVTALLGAPFFMLLLRRELRGRTP
ncbi:MAG TPA: iron ABC transporter permease [Pseudomonadales bacterium]|nr:iron ABC transporter permease [Pseudomonadales bacterium]